MPRLKPSGLLLAAAVATTVARSKNSTNNKKLTTIFKKSFPQQYNIESYLMLSIKLNS